MALFMEEKIEHFWSFLEMISKCLTNLSCSSKPSLQNSTAKKPNCRMDKETGQTENSVPATDSKLNAQGAPLN